MNFFITGDIHRSLSKFKYYSYEFKQHPENAVIILGDAGFNYFLDERDAELKAAITRKYKNLFYVVRGNHEARPQDVSGMQLVYDKNVGGEVYLEQDFPNIRYFKDFGEYTIGMFHCLVIGGAYSVDKFYRLTVGSGWFANEQLTEEEMNECSEMIKGKYYDFVLSHTCPREWEPVDLFLDFIDQNGVDKTMENWMTQIKDTFEYGVWLFGHYHQDRIERPYVEMFYNNTENMEAIFARWCSYETTGEIPWHYVKAPDYYMGNEKVRFTE